MCSIILKSWKIAQHEDENKCDFFAMWTIDFNYETGEKRPEEYKKHLLVLQLLIKNILFENNWLVADCLAGLHHLSNQASPPTVAWSFCDHFVSNLTGQLIKSWSQSAIHPSSLANSQSIYLGTHSMHNQQFTPIKKGIPCWWKRPFKQHLWISVDHWDVIFFWLGFIFNVYIMLE